MEGRITLWCTKTASKSLPKSLNGYPWKPIKRLLRKWGIMWFSNHFRHDRIYKFNVIILSKYCNCSMCAQSECYLRFHVFAIGNLPWLHSTRWGCISVQYEHVNCTRFAKGLYCTMKIVIRASTPVTHWAFQINRGLHNWPGWDFVCPGRASEALQQCNCTLRASVETR